MPSTCLRPESAITSYHQSDDATRTGDYVDCMHSPQAPLDSAALTCTQVCASPSARAGSHSHSTAHALHLTWTHKCPHIRCVCGGRNSRMESIVTKIPTHNHRRSPLSHVFSPASWGRGQTIHVSPSLNTRPFMKCFPTSNTWTVMHLPSRPSSFSTRTCSWPRGSHVDPT